MKAELSIDTDIPGVLNSSTWQWLCGLGQLYQTHCTSAVAIAIIIVLLTWWVCFHADPLIWS